MQMATDQSLVCRSNICASSIFKLSVPFVNHVFVVYCTIKTRLHHAMLKIRYRMTQFYSGVSEMQSRGSQNTKLMYWRHWSVQEKECICRVIGSTLKNVYLNNLYFLFCQICRCLNGSFVCSLRWVSVLMLYLTSTHKTAQLFAYITIFKGLIPDYISVATLDTKWLKCWSSPARLWFLWKPYQGSDLPMKQPWRPS